MDLNTLVVKNNLRYENDVITAWDEVDLDFDLKTPKIRSIGKAIGKAREKVSTCAYSPP